LERDDAGDMKPLQEERSPATKTRRGEGKGPARTLSLEREEGEGKNCFEEKRIRLYRRERKDAAGLPERKPRGKLVHSREEHQKRSLHDSSWVQKSRRLCEPQEEGRTILRAAHL